MSQVLLGVKLDYVKAEKEFKDLIKKLEGTTLDLKVNPVSGKVTTKVLKEIEQGVSKVDAQTKKLTTTNQKATTAQNNLNKKIKESDGFFTKLGKSITHDLGEMFKWSIAATAIYGSLRKIGEAVTYLTAMDTALTNIRMASGLTREETQGLAQDYLNLGKELGIAVEEIANSATELYRQGLSTTEVNDRLADYIKLSKVLGRDLQSTIEMGTAGTTAFGASIQKLGDIASAVGDATASSGDEIMIAIQKSGMSAQTANVSLEELAAMAATVSSTTRESGQIVGNSLKSILSKLSQVDGLTGEINDDYGKTLDRLNDVGIAIEDQSGNLLSATEILGNVGDEWENLSAQEQKYLASGFGVFQVNRFSALVRGMTKTSGEYVGNLKTAYDSYGATATKYEEYSKSIKASTERMNNEWKELYQNTLNSGVIISIVDLIGKFANLIDESKVLVLATVAVSSAILILAVKSIPSLILSMVSAISTTAFLGKGLWTLIPGLEALTIALGGFGTVLFGLVGLVAIVTIGLYKYKKAQDEAFQATLDTADALKKQNEESIKLMSSLDGLKGKTSLTREEQVKLEGVANSLIELYPELADKIDATTVSHEKLSIAMVEVRRNALEAEKAILRTLLAGEETKLSLATSEKARLSAMGEGGGEQTSSSRTLRIGIEETNINNAKKNVDEINKKIKDLINTTGIYENSEDLFGFDSFEKDKWKPLKKTGDSGSSTKENIDPLKELQSWRDAIDLVTLSLAKLDAEKENASDEEMIKILERENEQHKIMQVALHEYKLALDVQAKTLKKDSETYVDDLQKIRDEQKKLGLEWWDSEKAIQGNIKAIQDLGVKLREVKEKQADSLGKEIIDSLKKIKDQMEEENDSVMAGFDSRIQAYEDELDALKRKNEALDDEADRLKILKELEEARLRLANIKEQKNVRMYTGVGATGWEFVADPLEIKEQTEVISGLQDDLLAHDVKSAREAEEQKLEDKIDAQKRLKELEQQNYNERKAKFDKFQDLIEDAMDNHQKITSSMLNGWLSQLGLSENNSYLSRISALQSFVNQYNMIIAGLQSMPTVGLNIPDIGGIPFGPQREVKVDKSGNAQKGLSVGTKVLTGGGTYQIVKNGTVGSTYNKDSGYSSIKVDNRINGKASGGGVEKQETYRVNELGTEALLTTRNGQDFLTPLTNGKVLTAPQTREAMSGSKSSDINIGNITLPSVKNAPDFVRELQRLRIVNG